MHPPSAISLPQKLILENYEEIINKPIFIFSPGNSIHNRLKQTTNEDQAMEIFATCQHNLTECTPKPFITNPQHPKISIHHPKKCGHYRCETCTEFNESIHFQSFITKEQFRIRHKFTCHSNNIIYLITCKKCHRQYVGKTTNKLKVKMNGHRTKIRSKKNTYLCNHFNFSDHDIRDLSVQVIDNAHSTDKLDSLEKFWIGKLQTFVPHGRILTTIYYFF